MILLLDNYDSFVHNLARYLRRLGYQSLVVRSDEVDVQDVQRLKPDAVVISPGPKRPEQAGCSVQLIEQLDPSVPILGVCLGHQAIAVAFGGIVHQCGPMHGMKSEITHDEQGLFADCPSPMSVGRYHSLAIDGKSLPADLIVTAKSGDGVIMGVRHRTRPIYGVQFHPESVLTDHGSQLLSNFASMASLHRTAESNPECAS